MLAAGYGRGARRPLGPYPACSSLRGPALADLTAHVPSRSQAPVCWATRSGQQQSPSGPQAETTGLTASGQRGGAHSAFLSCFNARRKKISLFCARPMASLDPRRVGTSCHLRVARPQGAGSHGLLCIRYFSPTWTLWGAWSPETRHNPSCPESTVGEPMNRGGRCVPYKGDSPGLRSG